MELGGVSLNALANLLQPEDGASDDEDQVSTFVCLFVCLFIHSFTFSVSSFLSKMILVWLCTFLSFVISYDQI